MWGLNECAEKYKFEGDSGRYRCSREIQSELEGREKIERKPAHFSFFFALIYLYPEAFFPTDDMNYYWAQKIYSHGTKVNLLVFV